MQKTHKPIWIRFRKWDNRNLKIYCNWIIGINYFGQTASFIVEKSDLPQGELANSEIKSTSSNLFVKMNNENMPEI